MAISVRPLAAALAFGAGVALAPLIGGAAWWIAAVGLAVAAAAWRRELVLPALVAAGLARGAPEPRAVPAGAVADDRGDDVVTGVVAGPVVRTPRGTGARLDVDGGARVWLWATEPLVPGERLAATGRLRTPRGLLDPGVPDRGLLVAGRGADWELSARHLDHLGDAAGPLDLAWRWATAAQARGVAAIDDAGGDPGDRAALRGIALGDRGDVSPALDQRWRAIGIYHVLSVSGLHLAVVAGLAFALLRRLVAASPVGGRVRPARWAAPAALVIAVAFTLVTGAQLATLRALAVVALVLVAAMLDRPLRLVDALGLAALAILAWRPVDLRDPSFQLSFVAALTLARATAAGALPAGRLARVVARARRGVVASAWVALTTAPLTAYHFQQVAAGGIVGNLVLTPLVELVALPLALAGIVLPGGGPLIRVATWLVGAVDTAAGYLAHVTPVGRIAVASPIAMTALVALALWLAGRPRARRGWLDAAGWAAMCAVWALARTPPPAGALRVTFLDVGQGDAALVELPDGATWLVDAGGDAAALDPLAAAAPGRAIAATMAVHGRARIDLAILSHPHPDHYLGFGALAQLNVPVDELWSADPPAPTPPRAGLASFGEVAAGLAARGTRFGRPPLGVAREQAGVTLTAWAPRFEGELVSPDPVRTVNDNSLVVAISYRGRTILFAGDVEAEGEDALVAAGLPHVDVVKVPHHGSPTSSTAALVGATRPALAVISCGAGNRFGFPAAAVVARWEAAGAEVVRTDTRGAVSVTIDDDGALAKDTQAP